MALNFPSSPTNGDTFGQYVYDSVKDVWRLNPEAPTINIGDVNDITITSPVDGQALVYDSTSGDWVNETPASTLADLSDTLINNPADQEVLLYDGGESKWVNSVLNLDYAPRLLEETVTRTANYTLALDDINKVIPMNGTSLTVTVPANSSVAFPIGAVVSVYNLAATDVTISGAGGVTVRNSGILPQYGEISLRKRATDEWVIAGGAL